MASAVDTTGNGDDSQCAAWGDFCLPFLEDKVMADAMQAAITPKTFYNVNFATIPAAVTLARNPMSVFICPSDPMGLDNNNYNSFLRFNGQSVGKSNYLGCAGRWGGKHQ